MDVLDGIFSWLIGTEPEFNSLVALFAFLTAAGSFLRVIFSLRKKDERATGDKKQPLLIAIADLGLGPESQIDEAVSVRTLNVTLLAIGALALFWVVAGVIVQFPLLLMLGFVGALVFSIMSMWLNSLGFRNSARFLCLLIAAGYYFVLLFAIGPQKGVEYALIPIAILPIMMFPRREGGKSWIAIALVGAMLVITMAIAPGLEPKVVLQENVEKFGYYTTAAFLTVISFVVVNYYNFHSVRFFSDLEREKAQADTLLLDVFPAELVKQLRGEHSLIARSHGEATILYAQISGLAELFQRVSAVHVVEILDQLFSEFDKLAEQNRVRKIKTFGGIYIAASGLSDSDQGDPDSVARFALAMRARARALSAQAGYPLDIRIGVATGQVISGVIGRSRPSLDIWGETVQLADALVHSPFDEAILVNEPTYWRLKPHFHLSPATQDGWALPDGDSSYLLIEELPT